MTLHYKNFLSVMFILAFLTSACAKRQGTLAPDGGNRSLAFSSSIKTNDGKTVPEGTCIYGCPNIDPPGSRKESKSASLESSPGLSKNTAPSAGSQSIQVSPDYILGSEDIIDVLVWKNENLSKTVTIRPDGKISLPLIGDVRAAGLTTAQLRDSIKEKLKEYKETPEVSVIVKEINSLVVYITGEVTHPGKLMLRSDTSLLQAIIMAGGFTQFASTNKIVLLRRVGGVETRKIIRYKDIVSGKKPEDDILLQRGDTIVVP